MASIFSCLICLVFELGKIITLRGENNS